MGPVFQGYLYDFSPHQEVSELDILVDTAMRLCYRLIVESLASRTDLLNGIGGKWSYRSHITAI